MTITIDLHFYQLVFKNKLNEVWFDGINIFYEGLEVLKASMANRDSLI